MFEGGVGGGGVGDFKDHAECGTGGVVGDVLLHWVGEDWGYYGFSKLN